MVCTSCVLVVLMIIIANTPKPLRKCPTDGNEQWMVMNSARTEYLANGEINGR